MMVGYGGGSMASAWPNRMAAEIGTDVVRLINQGAVSVPTTSLTSQGATYIDPHLEAGRSRTVIMLQEGTNDILSMGASGATAWSNMVAWLDRLTAIWPASTRYVVCTVPNIDTARSGYDAAKQTAIDACNTLIRANWAAEGFHGIIDWADDALLDDATNATYTWGDGVHRTIAGDLKAAILAQAVVEPLLDTGSALAAGSISITTPATSTTVGLTVTEATGGTGPYTRLWHRSTSSGFTPSGANDLPGETSLTLADTGLTPSTTYYYKCVQTDSVAASVTTAQQAVTTTAGGGGGTYLTLSSGGAYLILGGA
jgi:lysophospholipase L1-like esterase